MENSTENKKHSSTEILYEAISNAELLLNYSTEYGVDVDEQCIATIIEAKNKKLDKGHDLESEIKFWIAYRTISKAVQPVTLDSLSSMKETEIKNPNWVQRFFKKTRKDSFYEYSAKKYRNFVLFWMIVLLSVQIFSLKGTTLLNTIQMSFKRIAEIDNRVGELRLLVTADNNNESASLERYTLESEKAKLDQEIKSGIELLEPWVKIVRKLFVLTTKEDKKKTVVKASETAQTLTVGPPPIGENTAEVSMNNQISIIQEAQNFTQIIQLYILPLLYGLIGGFVFVLRSITSDVKSMLFSKFSTIKYSLRLHLGALAGLIVGLLWGDIAKQQITFLESLSTSGFAFIAGYGIEYLFDGLDKLVAGIGKKPETAKK